MNVAILVGRLTDNPQTGTTAKGTAKTTFGLATNAFRGGEQTTEFHNCLAWGKIAEIIGAHAKKGSMVEITGSLQTKPYTNKQGVEVKRTEIVVNTFNFGARSEGRREGSAVQRLEERPDVMNYDPGW